MAPRQFISGITLVVADYDEALAFYVGQLGFELVEDSDLGHGKRWVVVAPPGSHEARLIIARATTPSQRTAIGNQAGGRVTLFLSTNDFARDHAAMLARGVQFSEAPRHEPYGIVAVFVDPFGNRWDLIEPARGRSG